MVYTSSSNIYYYRGIENVSVVEDQIYIYNIVTISHGITTLYVKYRTTLDCR